MVWYGYYCVGVIVYQYEIGDLYWDLGFGDWMYGVQVGIYVVFFLGFQFGFGDVILFYFGQQCGQCWV